MALESTPGGRQYSGDGSRRTGGREQLQAEGLNPGANHGRGCFRVVDESFASIGKIAVAAAADVVERRSQSTDQRDGRSKCRFALGLRLALLAQIEVEARLLGRLHALPGALAHAEIGESGRNHDRFLRAADEDIDAPIVHLEMSGAEAGDGVDDKQRVGAFEQGGDGLHVVTRAGGSLGGLHVKHTRAVELGLDFAQVEGLPVRNFDQFDLAGKGLGEIAPALAELSGGQHDHLLAGRSQVGNRGFHGAAAGRSENENVVLGADEGLEIGKGTGEDFTEFGRAVMHVRGGDGILSGWKKGSWTGSK